MKPLNLKLKKRFGGKEPFPVLTIIWNQKTFMPFLANFQHMYSLMVGLRYGHEWIKPTIRLYYFLSCVFACLFVCLSTRFLSIGKIYNICI